MSNLSQKKRENMLLYLNKLKEVHQDDESTRALNEIINTLNEKKYGLVWEEHSEEVDEKLKTHIPVFSEVEDRKIVANEEDGYNFLLEGDNLHSLKLLEKTHKGKIDVIYIDPPYNTGNKDFVYDDSYVDSEDGYRHSKWLSFMSKRLEVAKNLLSENGMIFISIDDNELANLRLLCDTIFGENSFVNCIAVKMSESTGVKMAHVEKRLPKLKEYILFYKKSSTSNLMLNEIKIPKEKWDDEYKILVTGVNKEELKIIKDLMNSDNISDEEINKADDICQRMEFSNVNTIMKDFKKIDEKLDFLHKNSYRILRDVATSGGAKRIADEKRDVFGINKGAFLIKTPRDKIYLMRGDYNKESKQPRMKMLFADQYLDVNVGDFWHDIKTTGLGAEGEIEFLNGKKPLRLITRLLSLNSKNIKVLDFFAGSGTTGHAVMELNKEDGGNRKYILCTNNENNICEEVTYQRMKNIQEELPHNLKYYKTDFIPKTNKKDESIKEQMLETIKTLIELENHIEIDNTNNIIINDEELLGDHLNNALDGINIYITSVTMLSQEEKAIADRKNIKLIEIPEYYYSSELREVGEI